jgi:iron complex outermembrane receptor protein
MRNLAVLYSLIAVTVAGYGGSLHGRALDRETHKPLPLVNITIGGSAAGTSTDTNGNYLLSGLPAGKLVIRASLVGYQSQTQTIEMVDGDSARADFWLISSPLIGQPVTVTATRGRDRETPATFATLDREALRDRYTVQDVPALLSELPSTTWYSESGTGLGYTYLNIRGFDSRRIAVMVNGIPQNDPEDHNVYWLDFPDMTASVEDIQVQRGAGSAFYGSPAIGGSVNLATSQFGSERSLTLNAGLGSFNTRKYSASFFSGLLDNRYAVHARLSKVLSSGYRDRAWVDFSSYFLGFIRYDETMTTQFNLYGGPISDGLAYYGIPKEDVTDRNRRRENPIKRPEEIENFSQPHVELLHEWHLSPSVTIANTLFLVLGDGFFDYDGAWAPYSYYRITPANGVAVQGDPDTLFLPGALIRAQVTNRQWGWLPRVTWHLDHGDLIAGGELRIHRSVHWGRLQWAEEIPAGVPLDYRYYEYKGAKDIASVYVHLLHDLGADVKLMASVQYIFNRYRLYDEKFIGTDFTVPYSFLNPRLGLNYNLTDRWNVYGSLAYTSREPRLKNLYDAAEASTPESWGAVTPQFGEDASGRFDFTHPLVKPESLFDTEIGAGYIADGARCTANIYWMEFTDEIVNSGQVDRFGQPITGNANRTRHIGLELSGKIPIDTHLDLQATASVSRNRFIHHTDYSAGAPRSLDGNPISGFPDVLANVRCTYQLERFRTSIAGRFVGRQNTDNFKDDARTADPAFITDFWASYRFERIIDDVSVEAKIQVNNLFDVLYAAYGEGDQFFVGAERNAFFNLTIHL